MTIEAIIWARRVTETGVLKTGQAFVLMLLGDHADESWSCFPSQELLARGTAQSVRSVQRQIDQLEQLGLISVKAVYGASGREGRTGSRYQLHPEALEGIVGEGAETRMDSRPDNLSSNSANRMSSRPDNLSSNSANRMDSRPDNLSPNSELGDNLTELGDNRDFADYKDRARTNPQEPSSVRPSVRQSGAVRAETTTDDGRRTDQAIDGGEGVGLVHRGVVLADLVQRVPAAADLGDGQLRSIVDVVLARASGPVRKPTAFVARSLASEFEELVAVTRPRPVAVAQGPAASGQVRELRTGEPCQDPDVHVPAYGQAVLADCPHCRLERRAMPRGLVEAVE
ncbi:helix-turn-helix domain-containing protein [Micrococcus luteus]|uniref:helix-turn-helix domain-containing protein n=1 Tax=Micrococcus luteus TaxID=1270 RepID=UPI001009633A|nr:helix-turn-helix domain-containing protein [Micrococcus luteus]QAV28078.1 helix-turn-helix domain-containing protein [Micrococcus luteus]